MLQNRMVGYKSLFASTAILGSNTYSSDFSKFIKFEQISCLSCTEEEDRFSPHILDAFSEIEQRSHTNTTTHKKEFLSGFCRHGKSIAQWKHTVEIIASLKITQLTSTITNHGYEQPKFISVTIYKIDGDRSAQHGIRFMLHLDFNKLSRTHFRKWLIIGKLNQNMLVTQ